MLDRLGITNSPAEDHNTHFHIYLRPPTARDLPRNLNAEVANEINAGVPQADAVANGDNQPFDISYIEDAQTGESTMLMSLLMPYLPPLDEASVASPPVIMAQATSSTPTMTLENCEDVQTPDNPDGPLGGELAPAASVRSYWYHKYNEKLSVIDAKVTIVDGPSHGKINSQWLSKTVGTTFGYIANPGFLGQDKITFLIEVGGKNIKVVTTLIVVKVAGLHGSPCFTGIKRISNNSEMPGLATNFALDQLASILTNAAGVTVTITPLAGGALGQTTNTNITLDDNAAGHNWLIDTTPGSNEEFLPTSNPYEWVAKAGSAAYGKMDMLSVLLHEYGHALGIDHSADSHDYMATTLTAGVRRLPSAEELALMQNLIAQAKGDVVG